MSDEKGSTELRFRTFVENSHELVSVLAADGTLRWVSPSISTILGFEPKSKTGAEALMEVHPEDREKVAVAMAELLEQSGRSTHLQYRVRHADGSWRTLDTTGVNHIEHPEIGGLVLTSRDITEQSKREERMRIQSQLLDAVGQALIATDASGCVTYWNRAAEELYGWTAEEALGESILQLTPSDQSREQATQIIRRLTAGESWRGEFEVQRRDGSRFLALVTNSPVQTSEGEIVGIIGTSSDITELKNTEFALQERVKELRVLYRASEILNQHGRSLPTRLEQLVVVLPDAWLYPSVTRVRLSVNGKTFQNPGFEETPWSLTTQINNQDERCGELQVVLIEERPEREEGPFLHEEQELLDSVARLVGNAVGRQQVERQLRQSQKMEAVGRLAGGVAHDFNNLLTVIRGQTDLILLDLDEHSAVAPELKMIQAAADRAAQLTSQLLAFSRDQVWQPRIVDAREVITGLIDLLARLLPETIVVRFERSMEPLPIDIDPTQLEQVLINLAVNARDAMPEGGHLTISAGVEERDDNSGPEAVVTVTDTGCGMDQATRDKIFEPFFTTKPRDKGTGLGLSMVYGVMLQAGGSVVVDSTPGEGTTFELRFPRATGLVEQLAQSEAPHPSESQTGAILVVEDNPQVRRVVESVLKRAGFSVHAVSDVESGLKFLETGPTIDAVITDLVLPGASGRTIVDHLRKEQSDVAVVLMSGYADQGDESAPLPSTVEFLQKPFTPDTLLASIKRALSSNKHHRAP